MRGAGVSACLSGLHNKYVFVLADGAPNNVIVICKRYCIETLVGELGLGDSSAAAGDSACTPSQMSSEAIVNAHGAFVGSFGVGLSDGGRGLPCLCWAPGLRGSPVEHRFIAGSSGCATRQLSSLLAWVLAVVGAGLGWRGVAV